MVAFIAKGVTATELLELNCKLVVLAEDSEGDGGPRLEISRALSHTAHDRELGQDTYCLSTQTGATVYGGVRWYALEGSTLTIRLDPEAYDALGVPEEFSILLDTNEAIVANVRASLNSILGEERGTAALDKPRR